MGYTQELQRETGDIWGAVRSGQERMAGAGPGLQQPALHTGSPSKERRAPESQEPPRVIGIHQLGPPQAQERPSAS